MTSSWFFLSTLNLIRVEHIISACPILSKKKPYIKIHERMCAEMHFNVCREIGVKLDNIHWYDHVPKTFETSHEGEVTISWNQQCEPTEVLLTINRT